MSAPNSADGAVLSPRPAQSETASGRFIDLLDPKADAIDLGDIARGLSLTCRYGGQVRRFYSVAEHAVLVHDLLVWLRQPTPILLAGLFHDAAEAYLGDVVSPLKWAMREETAELVRHGRALAPYDTITHRMERAIIARFKLGCSFDCAAVKLADMWALRIEARTLTRSGGAHWNWQGELPNDGQLPSDVVWLGGLDPDRAEELWLQRVHSHEQTDIQVAA